jgi:hypothetical protein
MVSSSVRTLRSAMFTIYSQQTICARNYTGFAGQVEIAAERERGGSLHGQRKFSQASCLQVTVTLAIPLLKAVTHEKAPL